MWRILVISRSEYARTWMLKRFGAGVPNLYEDMDECAEHPQPCAFHGQALDLDQKSETWTIACATERCVPVSVVQRAHLVYHMGLDERQRTVLSLLASPECKVFELEWTQKEVLG